MITCQSPLERLGMEIAKLTANCSDCAFSTEFTSVPHGEPAPFHDFLGNLIWVMPMKSVRVIGVWCGDEQHVFLIDNKEFYACPI